MTRTDENMISIYQRKILRLIFGGNQGNGIWRRRSNLELHQSYKESDIVNFFKIQQIKWAGHVVRMNEDRTTKKSSMLNQLAHEEGNGLLRGNRNNEGELRVTIIPSMEQNVLDTVRWNPNTSIQVIGAVVGGSRSSVHRVLQREGFLPYNLQRVPSLF
ncbi:uncharacterized protein TNCV_4235271 [Trichonephila clavipes]|nr:uncharacterized protein TNCV_4235271 [Trichonephila clavipes]